MAKILITRNNNLIKKALSLDELIAGSGYSFGTLDEYNRMVEFGAIGNGPIVVYDCKHIGRGVEILELSKKQLKLSLPLPATAYDIDVLYYLARRAAELWECRVINDPEGDIRRISLDDVDAHKKADYDSNIRILANWFSLDPGVTMLPCAMFPISIEGKTLESFGSELSYDGFAKYLHERQENDAYYTRGLLTSLPDMDSVSSLYVLIDQSICILPFEPKDFYRDEDNSVKECENCFVAYWQGENLLKMDYHAFLENVPSKRKKPFDASNWQLSPMSEEELVAIFNANLIVH